MKVSDFNVYDWFDIDSEVQQVMPVFIDEVFNDTMPAFCVQPIPLTADILMANGFERKQLANCVRYRLLAKGTIIWAEIDGLCWSIDLVTHKTDCNEFLVEYVHELQHLLRMAGLSDLADDFKLEKGGRQ